MIPINIAIAIISYLLVIDFWAIASQFATHIPTINFPVFMFFNLAGLFYLFAFALWVFHNSHQVNRALRELSHSLHLKLPVQDIQLVPHHLLPFVNTFLSQTFYINKLLLNQHQELQSASTQLFITQNSLLAEKTKFDTILAGIKDGVVVINRAHETIIFNPAATELTGASSTQALGKPVDQNLIFVDQDEPLLAESYCQPNQPTYVKEGLKLIGPNHQTRYVNLTVNRIIDNEHLGWIITLHNVTEEQELMRMKLDFASMAAHELRTPLTTVQGYLSFLQNPQTLAKLSPAEQEFITKASLSTSRLNRLIENVLSVSKIEQGQLTINLQPHSMEKLIDKLVTEYVGLALTKKLKLFFTSPPQPLPEIYIDALKIEEVISNLIGNAVKYTEKGYVEISAKLQGDFIIVAVTDTGKGIPSEAIGQLFTKFFRVQGELKSGSKGTGLGLYISKNIIESHGGKIWVESVMDQGSSFSFSLPISAPQSSTPTSAKA